MYLQYWGLSQFPFQNVNDSGWFCETPAHEECLARLLYLVEQQHQIGFLSGGAGTGKSLLLEVLADQVARSGRPLVAIDLFGLHEHELLWQLAAAFGLAPSDSDTPWQLQRRVHDWLDGSRLASIHTVLLFDRVDSAGAGCHRVLQRLLQHNVHATGAATFVFAASDSPASSVPRTLLELAELRVDLTPLDWQDAGLYITERLARAGASRSIFGPSAMDRVYEQTAGNPRRINRLCDLALLAGMADGLTAIDPQTVDSAAQELQLSPQSDRPVLSPV